jgi:prevent-host-death family protein
MATHSVAEARNHLSELIDRALEGEGVVITRHGQPVVELRPVQPKLKSPSPESWEWLAAHRASLGDIPAGSDAAQLVSDMRDEGEH